MAKRRPATGDWAARVQKEFLKRPAVYLDGINAITEKDAETGSSRLVIRAPVGKGENESEIASALKTLNKRLEEHSLLNPLVSDVELHHWDRADVRLKVLFGVMEQGSGSTSTAAARA